MLWKIKSCLVCSNVAVVSCPENQNECFLTCLFTPPPTHLWGCLGCLKKSTTATVLLLFFYFKMFLSHFFASGTPLCVVVFYHQWPMAHSSMIMPISITPGLCDNQEASSSFGCVRICVGVAVWGFTDSHGRWQPAGWSDLSWWYQTCSMFTSCNPDLQSDPTTFIPAVRTVWELLFNELK